MLRVEAIGWAHADACYDLDAGRDPRQNEIPEMLERAIFDLEERQMTIEECITFVAERVIKADHA